jgi:glycosyltransferase involved in cell wall biosynthesis
MRVLHLISSGGMYGAEAVILNLSSAMKALPGHQSILGVFANSIQPNLQLHETAVNTGIESHIIPCSGQLDLRVPKKIRSLAQTTQADLIHAHGYKADVYAWLAFRGAATPLVSTCHTWYDNDLALRLYGALDRFTLRRFDAVVAVSDDVRARLLHAGVAPQKIALIRNGIDLRPFAAAPSQRAARRSSSTPLTIGLVGRLSPEKGVDIFLRAAEEIAQRRPGTKFVVAGDGPDRASLEQLIAQLNLSGTASLLGRTSDMPAFYSSIDILVSASRQEGLPIALLEGLAGGLPLVATSVGAVPQIVQNGRTGLLVQAGDPHALAEAICTLTDDVTLRNALGQAAQQRIADEFSATRMTSDYLAIYRTLLAERNPAAASVGAVTH